MKKLILLLVLVATANAQTSGPFPFGQFGGSNSSGPTLPVLFYIDGATGTNGAQVTTSNLNAYGSSYCNTGLTVTTANSQLVLSNAISQAVPPMAYSVGGVTIPKNNSAYFFEYNPSDTNIYYVNCAFTSPKYSAVSFGNYYYTTMNGSADPSGLSIFTGVQSGGGDYNVTHWNGNACGSLTTNAAIHITSSDSGPICFSPSHLYYLTGLYNNGGSSYNGGGYHYLMMLDPSNNYQIVGSTRVVTGYSGAGPAWTWALGRDGADGSAGTGQTYFGYPVICSPTTYPCVPAAPTASAPTYSPASGSSSANNITVTVLDMVPTVMGNTSTNGINYCIDAAGTCTPGSSGTTYGTITSAWSGASPSGTVTFGSVGNTYHLRTQAVSTGWNSSTVTDGTYTIIASGFVQSCTGTSYATSVTCVFSSNVATNDFLVCGARVPGSYTGVADTRGSVWSALDSNENFYAKLTGSGADTVTFSSSGAANFSVVCHEVSGFASFDAHTVHTTYGPGTGGNGITLGSVTPAVANEYIFGWTVDTLGGGGTVSAGTSPAAFTLAGQNASGITNPTGEWYLDSGTSALNGTFTCLTLCTDTFFSGVMTLHP